MDRRSGWTSLLLVGVAGALAGSIAWSRQAPGAPVQEAAAAPDRAALEADFAAMLTGAKLVGCFTDDARPDVAPQPDSYTISKAEKLEGEKWRIQALVEYGGKSFPVPIVIDVKWAGSTPVMTLDDLTIPLLGTFTARVLFHGDSYAGIWRGPGHGGHMYGRVERAAADTPPPSKSGEHAGDGDGEQGGERDGDAPHGGPRADEAAPRTVDGARTPASDTSWPSFRGPSARGWADGHPTPATWDLASGENVRWRVALPGLAHSSPIVARSRVFVTSAVRDGEEAELKVGLYGDPTPVADEAEHAFVVIALDQRTGEVLWERTAWHGKPAHSRHPKSSYAASTPATDGERVVASFGTEGLYCYDFDGELLWKRDLGPMDAGPYDMEDVEWGYASSPVLHEGKVIVQCDVASQDFVAAFDATSGEELWRTARTEVSTWGSPTVDVREGRAQVICNGWKHIGGYALETGVELWKLAGGGDAPVPTPVVAHDLVFITNAHGRMAPIYAIRADATGELAMQHEKMAWCSERRGNYMQTPLVYGDELYCCHDTGVLTCYDARSGEEHYRERLGGGDTGFTASMVAAEGKLYATSEAGEVFVLTAGKSFERLATNELGDTCLATPAISAGTLYWRTRSELVAIALP